MKRPGTDPGFDVGRPIFFLAVGDEAELGRLGADLRNRFGADYEIVGESRPDSALTALEELAEASAVVALIIVSDLPGMAGVTFLDRVHAFHPGAKRVLLVEREYTSGNPVVQALTLGQIDHHLSTPWVPVERALYPAVSEFLADWARTSDRPGDASFKVMRVVGADSDGRSHELRDRLTRVGVPFAFHPTGSREAQELLARAGADGSRLPIVEFFDGRTLVDPTHAEIVEGLGGATRPRSDSYDIVILGAGPAGLAAAVYGASEGLRTLIAEPEVFGGQAGTSSLIRNYLGFHRGISGDDLAYRAFEQAWLFGADVVFAQEGTGIRARGRERLVMLSEGIEVSARAVVIATGVTWRTLGVPRVEAWRGRGVFYGAAASEAQAVRYQDVFVVGAGNSAGQAAVHLARHASSVTMLVRGAALAESMSDYLVQEITEKSNIAIRYHTEVIDGRGDGRLETITLRDTRAGDLISLPAAAVFVMIGGEPHTDWLGKDVTRDDRGYVITGRDLVVDGAPPLGWPLERLPLHLETSMPGVFAAGDVRHRSVKRVASAVGEGATVIQMVHEYLRDDRQSGDRV